MSAAGSTAAWQSCFPTRRSMPGISRSGPTGRTRTSRPRSSARHERRTTAARSPPPPSCRSLPAGSRRPRCRSAATGARWTERSSPGRRARRNGPGSCCARRDPPRRRGPGAARSSTGSGRSRSTRETVGRRPACTARLVTTRGTTWCFGRASRRASPASSSCCEPTCPQPPTTPARRSPSPGKRGTGPWRSPPSACSASSTR